MRRMNTEAIIAAVQSELRRHDWGFFVESPQSMPQGGSGAVVAGCPACSLRINTHNQFIDHLSLDVIPRAIRQAMKVEDCETVVVTHEWYNIDDVSSGCYHCNVVRAGQLWRRETD
jgi:hypothetical protein